MSLNGFDGRKFYTLSPEERLNRVKDFANLTENEIYPLQDPAGLSLDQADQMIENVIGTIEIPVGLGVNFVINNRDFAIPMAIEESSVVAAASKIAKIARKNGGFFTSSTPAVMIGQIQITGVKDPYGAKMRILAQEKELLEMANQQDPLLVKFGGGATGLEVRIIESQSGTLVVCHLLVDCKDAMGANAVNTMVEALADTIEKISGGKVYLRIISNLAVKRLARAYTVLDCDLMGGEEVVDGIVSAYHFANADPFRAATHNKGIMNGISAVALALGQDTRAIEAGAHAYAAFDGQYRSLSTWEKNEDGNLVGTLELPMAVGLVGGAVNIHPVAKTNLRILQIQHAYELAEIMVAVGLAQNAGALRALANEGIQKGHMALHARNIALSAGATPELVDIVVERLLQGEKIRLDIAQKILEEVSGDVLSDHSKISC